MDNNRLVIEFKDFLPSKKLCTEQIKLSGPKPLNNPISPWTSQPDSTSDDFILSVNRVDIDKCPICLRHKPLEYTLSCQRCSTYICNSCSLSYRFNIFKKDCPVCKSSHGIREISFKEKQFLKLAQGMCSKCSNIINIEDLYSLIRHKLECKSNWIPAHMEGDTNKLDMLIDGLLSNLETLNNAVINNSIGKLDEIIEKETGRSWNIFLSKSFSYQASTSLAIKNKDDVHLIFIDQK